MPVDRKMKLFFTDYATLVTVISLGLHKKNHCETTHFRWSKTLSQQLNDRIKLHEAKKFNLHQTHAMISHVSSF